MIVVVKYVNNTTCRITLFSCKVFCFDIWWSIITDHGDDVNNHNNQSRYGHFEFSILFAMLASRT